VVLFRFRFGSRLPAAAQLGDTKTSEAREPPESPVNATVSERLVSLSATVPRAKV